MPRHLVGLHVHHEWAAMVSDVQHALFAGGGADDVRMRQCIRARPQHRQLQVPEAAVMLEFVTAPGGEHDGLGFLEVERLVLRTAGWSMP